MVDQVRSLADRAEECIDLMSGLTLEHGIYIAAGMVPIRDPEKPDRIYNGCHFFAPGSRYETQGKMHMTRFEKEVWKVSPSEPLRVSRDGVRARRDRNLLRRGVPGSRVCCRWSPLCR